METKAKNGDLVCVTTRKHSVLEFGEAVEIGTVFDGDSPQYEVAYRYYDNGDPLFLREGEFLLINNPEDYSYRSDLGADRQITRLYKPKHMPYKAKTGDLVRVTTEGINSVNVGEVFKVGETKPSVSGCMQYEMLDSTPENEDNVFLFGDEFELFGYGEGNEPTQQNDAVNHPNHYTQGRFEVIDIIEDAVQGADPFEAVCLANVIKYTTRYRHKNGVEDLKKAQWYLAKLITILEGGNE